MSKSRIYTVSVITALFLFVVYVALWLYCYQRYFVFNYHEQAQLFQFNAFYFNSYLNRPGGLAEYVGSFLTQFYYYPVVGSAIIAVTTAAAILIIFSIYNIHGKIVHLFFIPFIPAILMVMSFLNIRFNISYTVGLLFTLFLFRLSVLFRVDTRYIAHAVALTLAYFFAAGNIWLLLALIIIFELFEKEHRFKYHYLLLLIVLSVLLPWIAWRTLYTVLPKDAYFSLTPLKMLFPTIIHKLLWLSIPALFLFWRLIAKKVNIWKITPWKIVLPNCLMVVVFTVFGLNSEYDRNAEILYRMESEVQRNNWETTIELGNTYPGKNRLVCFYINIALAKTGQLPYRMFHFKQTGPVGLFFDGEMTYFTLGEIYYQLGMIYEAEHSAFEALVFSPKEPNARVLSRLVYTNIARRDSSAAAKYLKYFEQSFAYRRWAKQQRENLACAMADPLYHIPGAPLPYSHRDFFINYEFPDQSLLTLLEANPKHRMAFEYLMAYYMLQKDIMKAKWCMDTFYNNFNYPALPTHYEEAMLVYHSMMKAGDDFFKQYPVGNATRERFGRYLQAFNSVQGNKRNSEYLEKQFGNTYWYYLHFITPVPLTKDDEKNRY